MFPNIQSSDVYGIFRIQFHWQVDVTSSHAHRFLRLGFVFGQLNNLERAFDDVKKQLFDQLHDVLRSQLFVESRAASPLPTLALPSPSDGKYGNGLPTGSHVQSDEESESRGSESLRGDRESRGTEVKEGNLRRSEKNGIRGIE